MLTANDRVQFLREVTIFANTPDDFFPEVAGLFQEVALPSGEILFHKGDVGDCMYIIVTGRVQVRDGERILEGQQGPHEVIGEMALLDEHIRSATVVALEDTSLLRLDEASFYQMITKRPEIVRNFIRVLSRYLRFCFQEMAQDFAYIQEIRTIAKAATDLQNNEYDPSILDTVVTRSDELGQLAIVFRQMAGEVVAREQKLREQVYAFQIEIDLAKAQKYVSEITETEYFQMLEKKAVILRQALHGDFSANDA